MRAVDQTPTRADVDALRQERDRRRSVRRPASLDLANLFARVHVDWDGISPQRVDQLDQPREIVELDRAQRVRCDAERDLRIAVVRAVKLAPQIRERIEREHKAQLTRGRRRVAEVREPVQDRDKGQSDARPACGSHDPIGEFRAPRVGHAAARVMDVVELADVGVTRLEHRRIRAGGDRFELVRFDRLQHFVHRLAPGPERITGRPGPLGAPRERALERMGMYVRHAREDQTA